MDYHLSAIVNQKNPTMTSTLRIAVTALDIGVGALDLIVFPYFNPVITRKDLPAVVAWGGTQANTTVALKGTQGDAIHTMQAGTDRSERDLWEVYLASITEPIGSFSVEQVGLLKRVWTQACERLGDCPVPITQPGDEGSLQLAWDNGEKYIDIEATIEGCFHWYYRDRETNEVLGTSDQAIAQVDSAFFDKLADVVVTKQVVRQAA